MSASGEGLGRILTVALGLCLGILAMALAYRLGPNHGRNPPPMLSWGLLVAVVLWVLAASVAVK